VAKVKKPTKKEIKQAEEASKSDVIGFTGGLSVKLDRRLKSSSENLRSKLSLDVSQWLEDENRNQAERIENIAKWQRMYRGQREAKNTPYAGCSNIAIPVTRINTEAVFVRIVDGFWSQPKFWTVMPQDQEDPKENEMWEMVARQFEDDMEWWQQTIDMKGKLLSPLMQAEKVGRGIVKMEYVSRKRTVTRYARKEEADNPDIQTFKLSDNQHGIKEVVTEYEGPDLFPISREDWVQSSDSTNIQDAFFVGFRKYLREPEIMARVHQGLYDKAEAKKLLAPDEIDETKLSRAEEQGKEIPPGQKDKFEIWELWFKYDVDEDGEEDDIVVTFHPETRTILRCIYNPIFNKFRPFVDFIGNPVEYCADGEGSCEVLESLQVAIDTIHNQRNDRLTQINSPILFYNKSAFVDEIELIPGMTYPTDADPTQSLYEFKFSDTTYSTIGEEQLLLDYANKATGVTPDVLGQPTANRPVFREMASRLQEANKKFKFKIDNYRRAGEQIGWMYLEMSAQYQPSHSYQVKDGEKFVQKTINYPLEYLRDGIKVKLSASSELMNQEIRRETAMMRYNLLKEYYTSLAGMAQAVVSPQVPPEFKQLLVRISQISEKELENILRDLDTVNPDAMVLDIADALGEQGMARAMSQPYMPQPPGQPGGQGGGQGRKPPQGGAPNAPPSPPMGM